MKTLIHSTNSHSRKIKTLATSWTPPLVTLQPYAADPDNDAVAILFGYTHRPGSTNQIEVVLDREAIVALRNKLQFALDDLENNVEWGKTI